MANESVLPAANLLVWTAAACLQSYLKALPLVPVDVLRSHVLNLGPLIPLVPPEFDQVFPLEPGTVAFAFCESPYEGQAVELRAFRQDESSYVIIHQDDIAWRALRDLRRRYPVLQEAQKGLDERLVTLVDRRPDRGRRVWLMYRRFLNQQQGRLLVELDRVADVYRRIV